MRDVILNCHSSALHNLSRLKRLLCHLPKQMLIILRYKEIKDNLPTLGGTIANLNLFHQTLKIRSSFFCFSGLREVLNNQILFLA
jgi:hypothetical protein